MTVDQLHDALTLLPADLVAQADRHRGRPRRASFWRPLAAMAACLALVMGCGFFFFTNVLRCGSSAPALSGDKAMAPTYAETAADNEALPEALPQEPDTGAAAEGFLVQPPALTLTAGDSSLTVNCASCSWRSGEEDWATSGAAPTDPESLPLLDTETPEVSLSWPTVPESVTLQYRTEDVEIPVSGETLTLEKGGVYELTARWPEGEATYVFRMNANWEG